MRALRAALCACALQLAACAQVPAQAGDGAVLPAADAATPAASAAKPGSFPRLGDPPARGAKFPSVKQGTASWYGAAFHGKRTASGERFDMHDFTAAHPTLPFGTIVEVKSLSNGRKVRVRINDRGPHTGRRMIDLSHAAAEALGLTERGLKLVELRVVPPSEAVSEDASDASTPLGAQPPAN